MKHVYIIKRSKVLVTLLVLCGLIGGYYAFQNYGTSMATSSEGSGAKKEFTIITTEFKAKMDDGKVIEVYRWDPGVLFVEKGDHVTLKFYGVHGAFHPFEIKGLGIQGEVKKGRETVVSFVADKEGTFEIICTSHSDHTQNGPMVGYLVVD